jgi:hypothetical protein
LAKILKCAGNDDVVTMKAADDGDTVTLMFESPSECAAASRLPYTAAYFLAAHTCKGLLTALPDNGEVH